MTFRRGGTVPGEATSVGPSQRRTPPGRGVSIVAVVAVLVLVVMVAGFLAGRVASL